MSIKKYTTLDSLPTKRVSYILTTKNRAKRLRETLELHKELIGPEDELIIVDGLSSDNTAEIVSKYSFLIDKFISEPDVSVAHALNKGIIVARGKYIKNLMDDDVIQKEAMEEAIRILEKNPEVDFLVTGGIKQKGNFSYPVCLPAGANYGKSCEDVFKYGACGAGFVQRRSVFSKIGLFDINDPIADFELVLRSIKRKANVKFCRINLYHHPIYDHSYVNRFKRECQESLIKLAKKYCSRRFLIKYYLTSFYYSILQRFKKYIPLDFCSEKDNINEIVWDGGFS